MWRWKKIRVILLLPVYFPALAAAHPGLHHDIERVTQSLQADPRRADLYLERGFFHRLNGDPEQALVDLDRAAALQPDMPGLALHRGLTLSALNRDVEAERELSHVLTLPDAPAAAWLERGRVRERLGRRAEAADDYARAIALEPQPDAYLLRGRLLESLGRLEDAAASYRDGLAKLHGAVSLRLELIRVESAARRFDAAIEQIDIAMHLSENKADWLLQRGEVNAAAGRTAAARRDREHALEECRRRLTQRPSALRLFQRARASHALGREADAVADLRAALTKSPRYVEARELLQSIRACSTQPAEVHHAPR